MLRRPRTWIVAAIALAFLALVVAPFVYVTFINNPPEELGFDDLGTGTSAGEDDEAAGTTPTTTTDEAPSAEGATTYEVAEGSVAGYRVPETIAGQSTEGVGRTSDVTGELVLAGTTVESATFTVDMTTVASDRATRDGQFRNRIMDTTTFPTATFVLTGPIELGSLPADLEPVTVSATGDLTLRGVTRTVTFDLTARRNGANIEVDAAIAISFDDFEIPDASGGPARVGRDGTIEAVLAFVPTS